MRRLQQRRPSPRWYWGAMIQAARSQRILLVQGQDELKCRTGPLIAVSRQSSAVSFHNRAADRESHTHAAAFSREESIEYLIRFICRVPNPLIGYAYEKVLFFGLA